VGLDLMRKPRTRAPGYSLPLNGFSTKSIKVSFLLFTVFLVLLVVVAAILTKS